MSTPGARQLFRSFRRKAPEVLPYDAEVKWIKSTGAQYIDTGVHGSDNIIITTSVFLPISASGLGGANPIFGCVGESSNYQVGVKHSSSAFSSGLNTKMSGSSGSVVFDEWSDLELDTTSGDKQFIVDGVVCRTLTSGNDKVSASTICLFGFSGADGAVTFGQGGVQIRNFSVSDANMEEDLIDLIPVRFTNELHESEGAMYDRVSKKLFRNKGTGKLIVGEDVGTPYDREVAYVQHHQADFGVACKIPLPSTVLDKFPSGIRT